TLATLCTCPLTLHDALPICFRIAPYGLLGGVDGRPGAGEVLRQGKKLPLKSKENQTLQKGDIVTIYTAGGGGYGPAHERKREDRSEEHTSELQSRENLVCRL